MEEEEKKRLDIEEEKYQAQIRKEAIEKAETQQHYQTDRVKGLHNTALIVEEENQIQKYADQVMETAEKAARDIYPLLKNKRQSADTARA
ncbi:hypothetical protein R3I93_017481 [Phoxinus phoxinus]|uniref:Uncharacterized protein n=1 Tax=Phoxinus phoxinus TaxID=58324 RepID=A0AAN9CI53_9TELE